MKSSVVSLVVILSFALISCDKNSYDEQIKQEINNFLETESDSYDYVVLVPSAGCTGCITKAERYFVENVSNDRIKFIFTNILSNKELALRLGAENIQKKNVYLDTLNMFYLHRYEERIYPHIIEVINDSAISVSIL